MRANTARRGIRRFALNRLLEAPSAGAKSRSSANDTRTTYGLLAGTAFGALMIHELLKSTSGAIRLLIIGAVVLAVLAVLIIGGIGVRPFARKAYGLARSRAVVTTPDVDQATITAFSSLHLTPSPERLLSASSSTPKVL